MGSPTPPSAGQEYNSSLMVNDYRFCLIKPHGNQSGSLAVEFSGVDSRRSRPVLLRRYAGAIPCDPHCLCGSDLGAQVPHYQHRHKRVRSLRFPSMDQRRGEAFWRATQSFSLQEKYLLILSHPTNQPYLSCYFDLRSPVILPRALPTKLAISPQAPAPSICLHILPPF
jgi:hypothetical protein